MRLQILTRTAFISVALALSASVVQGEEITIKPRPLLPGETMETQTMFDVFIRTNDPMRLVTLGFETSSMQGRAALLGNTDQDAALVKTKAQIGSVSFLVNRDIPKGETKLTLMLPKHPTWIRISDTLSTMRRGDQPAEPIFLGSGAVYGTPPSKKKP